MDSNIRSYGGTHQRQQKTGFPSRKSGRSESVLQKEETRKNDRVHRGSHEDHE